VYLSFPLNLAQTSKPHHNPNVFKVILKTFNELKNIFKLRICFGKNNLTKPI
jgi:hypothetical protein